MDDRFLTIGETLFGSSPNPRYYYDSPAARQALAGLIYGIRARKGFVALTGDAGTGKTTLLLRLLDDLNRQGFPAAFVFTPRLNPLEFLHFVLTDFQIEHEPTNKAGMLFRFNQKLLSIFRQNRTAVLIVDEAQTSTADLLEEIRLLTNLETSTEKLLQIVIAGRPELEEMLKRTELRQLHQRIAIWERTQPLGFDETRGYIAERLRAGGAELDQIFAAEATEKIWEVSKGVPRLINQLCEAALVGARATRKLPISEERIDQLAVQFNLGLTDRDVETVLANLMQQFPSLATKPAVRDQDVPAKAPAIPTAPPAPMARVTVEPMLRSLTVAANEPPRSTEPTASAPAKIEASTASLGNESPVGPAKEAVISRQPVSAPPAEPPRRVNGRTPPQASAGENAASRAEPPASPLPPKVEPTVVPPPPRVAFPTPPRALEPMMPPLRRPPLSSSSTAFPLQATLNGGSVPASAVGTESTSKTRWLWGILAVGVVVAGVVLFRPSWHSITLNPVSAINRGGSAQPPVQSKPTAHLLPAAPVVPPTPQPAKISVKQSPPTNNTTSPKRATKNQTRQARARENRSINRATVRPVVHTEARTASSRKPVEAKSSEEAKLKAEAPAKENAATKTAETANPPVLTSKIDLVATPSDAQIFIDGKSYGAFPVHATIGPGKHSYRIVASGMKPESGEFKVAPGEVFGQSFALTPAAPPQSTWNVLIATDPPGASLYVDGAPIPPRTPTSLRLSTGHHTLIIFLGGYKPERREINVPAAGAVNIRSALERE